MMASAAWQHYHTTPAACQFVHNATRLQGEVHFRAAEELLMSYRKLAEEQDVSGDILDELQMLHSWLLRRE